MAASTISIWHLTLENSIGMPRFKSEFYSSIKVSPLSITQTLMLFVLASMSIFKCQLLRSLLKAFERIEIPLLSGNVIKSRMPFSSRSSWIVKDGFFIGPVSGWPSWSSKTLFAGFNSSSFPFDTFWFIFVELASKAVESLFFLLIGYNVLKS